MYKRIYQEITSGYTYEAIPYVVPTGKKFVITGISHGRYDGGVLRSLVTNLGIRVNGNECISITSDGGRNNPKGMLFTEGDTFEVSSETGTDANGISFITIFGIEDNI